VIESFKHAGLKRFFQSGDLRGIQPAHAKKLFAQLSALDVAKDPVSLPRPTGWKLHKLKGGRKEVFSMWVSGNWRLTFSFNGDAFILLNYEDYHGK
jgi:proteic killer suppression protein